MKPIRVAIAGAGNCAFSFAQFVAMAQARPDESLPGLMCSTIGGYRLSDVSIVLAFDVDAAKVGHSLEQAWQAPTISASRYAELGADARSPVLAAPVLDGIEGPLGRVVDLAPAARDACAEDVGKALLDYDVDVLAILLPTGSRDATLMFARAAMSAGVSVFNGTPEELARRADISAEFAFHGLPLIGDDMRSHLGATTLHTALLELVNSRGLRPDTTYQLNVGGNTDFLNLADPERARTKFASKANALRAAGLTDLDTGAGPTGFIAHLKDSKVCYINIRAESVLGSMVELEVKLKVEDSPNAAGVLASGVRAAQAARDLGVCGAVNEAAALLCKSPPSGLPETAARAAFMNFAHKLERED